ncbi:FAD-dependent oxidoreductase [Paenibacillus sp. EPM92]|uniref:FAD-dependent oxidoreductase n=1 Tax=Paenibacillus sp. EPM92 TaxID=1561195 RepID=UPI00191699E0|nr:FAD-dependent oxidoreductase [Paenibacillus sp. EPM92]
MQVHDQWDVIVVGGGTAGAPAAIAAARNGAKVLVVEKNGYLGGASTSALVSPYANHYDAHGEPTIAGLFKEILDSLKEMGACHGPIRPKEGNPPWGKNPVITPFDDEYLKFVLTKMAKDAGVSFLYHTLLKDVWVEDGVVKGITVFNKSGAHTLFSKVIVDCTGDADVAVKAGAKTVKGRERDGEKMPVTVYCRVGNVNVDRVEEEIKRNRDNFRWYAIGSAEGELPAGSQRKQLFCSGFWQEIAAAKENGEYNIGRETLNLFTNVREGEVTVNATRVNFIDGTNASEVTAAEVELRYQTMSVVDFLRKRVPGFEKSFLIKTANEAGIRETHRIIGEYILTQEDVVKGTRFDDVVARGGYAIDIHNPGDSKSTWIQVDDSYDVPYRALLPVELEGLLVAGRCISATHEAAAAVRAMPSCVAIGEAAGTAAALATTKGLTPKTIDVQELKQVLTQNGVLLA